MEEKKEEQSSGLRWYEWSYIVVALLFIILGIYLLKEGVIKF